MTVKNYRCFPDTHPLQFTIAPGFTAFIGKNNAGKSSILRLFYETRQLWRQMTTLDALVNLCRGETLTFGFERSVTDLNEFYSNLNERPAEITFSFSPDRPNQPQFLHSFSLSLTRGTGSCTGHFKGSAGVAQPHRESARMNPTMIRIANTNEIIDCSGLMHLAGQLAGCLYVGPFRNAINVGTNENYFDIEVGQSFIKAWRQYKTGSVKIHNELTFKLTSDIQRIFGFHHLEINPSPSDDTMQVFIDGRSYRLHEIGSGLTQFILVLANAAVKRPTFILIDEPELNLHPSLQLDFLTTLASYATGGILFSTHNIGLAQAAADRVYGVRMISQGQSEVYPLESMPRLADFVGELSFSGYKELGFDRILLVEGATEVRTMQQFLRMLRKEHKVVILPLGGSALINGVSEPELQEVTRISKHVSALIDSERSFQGEPLNIQRDNFRRNCASAGIVCHVLERRATDNYLSERAIRAVMGDKYTALGPYERLGDRQQLGWSKGQNWRVAREMSLSEIENTDLKAFLDTL